MKWQPIETAPKDARGILLYVPENRCIYGAYWGPSSTKNGWCVFGGIFHDYLQRATHWVPLPEPPESTP
jgi:hypothetical protein